MQGGGRGWNQQLSDTHGPSSELIGYQAPSLKTHLMRPLGRANLTQACMPSEVGARSGMLPLRDRKGMSLPANPSIALTNSSDVSQTPGIDGWPKTIFGIPEPLCFHAMQSCGRGGLEEGSIFLVNLATATMAADVFLPDSN